MRTSKINIVYLEPDEKLEVSYAGASVRIEATVEPSGLAVTCPRVCTDFESEGMVCVLADEQGLIPEAVGLEFFTFHEPGYVPAPRPHVPVANTVTVGDIKKALADYPENWVVHLDISVPEWEGERILHALTGVRQLPGLNAIALEVVK